MSAVAPTNLPTGMLTVQAPAELRALLEPRRRRGQRIGLVPTMGALHEGHLSLIRRARAEVDVVVVSVFVNPTQFGPNDDLGRYPRDEGHDAALAAAEGVDLLFTPRPEEMYPPGFDTWVEVGGLTEVLEGDARHRGRDHFRGVTTVVAKLFNMVGPHVAFFGQKDAQQALVIEKLVRDLDLPLAVVTLPTVRDADGLALSSRNVYLSPSERRRALALARGLRAVELAAAAGERDVVALLRLARAELDAHGVEADYLELRSRHDLTPLARLDRDALLLVAAHVGSTRLIDNVVLTPGPTAVHTVPTSVHPVSTAAGPEEVPE